MLVRIRTPIRPTEDPDLVRQAVLCFFPDAELRTTIDAIEGVTRSLDTLRQRIWELRIIDTFRGQFLHWMDPEQGAAKVRLSKQAALAGKVSFSPRPHPLGDLDVVVVLEPGDPWADIERLAFWLCPETKDGEIVGPT